MHIHSSSFREISVEKKRHKSSFCADLTSQNFWKENVTFALLHNSFLCPFWKIFAKRTILYYTLRIFFSPQVHGWLNALTDAFLRYFAEIAWFCKMGPEPFRNCTIKSFCHCNFKSYFPILNFHYKFGDCYLSSSEGSNNRFRKYESEVSRIFLTN